MLLNSLYFILANSVDGNLIEATIELNEAHEIFKGHFPSKPILPGVCEVEMIKEMLENSLNKKLFLQKADEIKFLQMIEPATTKQLKFQIQYKFCEEKFVDVNAKILKPDETICCKMKGRFLIK